MTEPTDIAAIRRMLMTGLGHNAAMAALDRLAAAPSQFPPVESREAAMMETVVKLALEAHAHWDADRDSKVGKFLLALAGLNRGYDKRIDELHALATPSPAPIKPAQAEPSDADIKIALDKAGVVQHTAAIIGVFRSLRPAPVAEPAQQDTKAIATIHVDGSFVHVEWKDEAPVRCHLDVYVLPQSGQGTKAPTEEAVKIVLRVLDEERLVDPEWVNARAVSEKIIAALAARSGEGAVPDLIDWVVERWYDEVSNRPMVNIHRRSLDGTWRQILRHLGVDDRERLGPTHDDLRSEINTNEWLAMNAAAPSTGSEKP